MSGWYHAVKRFNDVSGVDVPFPCELQRQMTDDGLFQVAWSGFTKGVHHKAEDDPQINQHQDKVGKLFYQFLY